MRKIFLPFVLLCVIALLMSCTNESEDKFFVPSLKNQIIVANSNGETVSIIDIETDQVFNGLYTTGLYSAEIDTKDRNIYVANSGDNTLEKINVDNRNISNCELGDNRNPIFFEFCGSDMIAVSNWVAGTITLVDESTLETAHEISVGPGPWDILYYNEKLFIGLGNYDMSTWSFGQGQLLVMDVYTLSIDTTIDIGTNPGPLFIDNEGELNVICTGDYFSAFGTVYIIDTNNYTILNTLNLGGSPTYAAINEDGIVYAGAGGWSSEAYVITYDSNTETVIRGADNPIVIPNVSGAQGVAIDNEGFIYVCCFNSDVVVKMDSTGNILKEYAVGDGPQTIVYVE